jgi:hypothetical protein
MRWEPARIRWRGNNDCFQRIGLRHGVLWLIFGEGSLQVNRMLNLCDIKFPNRDVGFLPISAS